jgi:hypothetical protein
MVWCNHDAAMHVVNAAAANAAVGADAAGAGAPVAVVPVINFLMEIDGAGAADELTALRALMVRGVQAANGSGSGSHAPVRVMAPHQQPWDGKPPRKASMFCSDVEWYAQGAHDPLQ